MSQLQIFKSSEGCKYRIVKKNTYDIGCNSFKAMNKDVTINFAWAMSGKVAVLLYYSIEVLEGVDCYDEMYNSMLSYIKDETSAENVLVLDSANVWG